MSVPHAREDEPVADIGHEQARESRPVGGEQGGYRTLPRLGEIVAFVGERRTAIVY